MSKVILFQGDSITDSQRDRKCDGLCYGLGNGYALLAASRLLADHPNDGLQFFNHGISGNRVVDLYARWKQDTINVKPDILSILIGVNDTWHEAQFQNGVELDRFEAIYRMLVEWTLKALTKCKLLLMEPFALPFGQPMTWEAKFRAEIPRRGKIVKAIAKDFNVTFLPLQKKIDAAVKAVNGNYSHLLMDGVHPACAGHQLIADEWIKATKEFF